MSYADHNYTSPSPGGLRSAKLSPLSLGSWEAQRRGVLRGSQLYLAVPWGCEQRTAGLSACSFVLGGPRYTCHMLRKGWVRPRVFFKYDRALAHPKDVIDHKTDKRKQFIVLVWRMPRSFASVFEWPRNDHEASCWLQRRAGRCARLLAPREQELGLVLSDLPPWISKDCLVQRWTSWVSPQRRGSSWQTRALNVVPDVTVNRRTDGE